MRPRRPKRRKGDRPFVFAPTWVLEDVRDHAQRTPPATLRHAVERYSESMLASRRPSTKEGLLVEPATDYVSRAADLLAFAILAQIGNPRVLYMHGLGPFLRQMPMGVTVGEWLRNGLEYDKQLFRNTVLKPLRPKNRTSTIYPARIARIRHQSVNTILDHSEKMCTIIRNLMLPLCPAWTWSQLTEGGLSPTGAAWWLLYACGQCRAVVTVSSLAWLKESVAMRPKVSGDDPGKAIPDEPPARVADYDELAIRLRRAQILEYPWANSALADQLTNQCMLQEPFAIWPDPILS